METACSTRERDAAWVGSIDAAIGSAIAERGFPGRLGEAMRYAALGPGKRVRPLLCVKSFVAVGGAEPNEAVLTAAAALEMVHAFSLVHDDLPAMDDDDLRRGRPTVHKAFDEATAILAGDALQGLAWELISGLDGGLSSLLSRELSTATNDMIAGQVLDTFGGTDERKKARAGDLALSEADRLRRVHRLKTGALLRAACRMGAWCGGADASALSAVTAYADALGLMFQAVDDLLDVTSDAVSLGKATQKDAEAGKLTYPKVFGVEGTRAEVAELLDRALSAVSGFGPGGAGLREVAEGLAIRTR